MTDVKLFASDIAYHFIFPTRLIIFLPVRDFAKRFCDYVESKINKIYFKKQNISENININQKNRKIMPYIYETIK